MNEKTNLQDLAAMMASKSGISIKDVEYFLKEFIETVQENLLKDEPVRIKNLGTFKRITVGARESVDVSTGQRVNIPAHYKINFVTDNDLAKKINEPFDIFEPTEIPDDLESPPAQPEPEADNMAYSGFASDRNDVMPEMNTRREIPIEQPQIIDPSYPPPTKHKTIDRRRRRRNTRWISTLIFLLLIIVGLAAVGYFLFLPDTSTPPPIPSNQTRMQPMDVKPMEEDPIDTDLLDEDLLDEELFDIESILAEPIDEDPTTVESIAAEPIVEDPIAVEPIVEKPVVAEKPAEEKLVAEKPVVEKPVVKQNTAGATASAKQYTLQRGDLLTKIALTEYGHKIFWVYLYEENKEKIKDPNKVPAGLSITIPAASKYSINKDDAESVRKATALQQQYYKEFPPQQQRTSDRSYQQQYERYWQEQNDNRSLQEQYNNFMY